MGDQESKNGWAEYRKLVLKDLDRHEELLTEILRAVSRARTDIALLQLRAGIWGFAAGALPVILLLLMNYMKGVT